MLNSEFDREGERKAALEELARRLAAHECVVGDA
jgi:hypothetical protein